jgi:hypothetical protein
MRLLELTGLTTKEFKALLSTFTSVMEKVRNQKFTGQGKSRKRVVGGGRKATLQRDEDKLLFILVYVKTYPLQVLMSELFGMSLAGVNNWIHRLLPVLKQALDKLDVKPERHPERFAYHERKHANEHDLIIDGTERRRQRPKDTEKQALYYSGKKKTHTEKNVMITDKKTKRVAFLSKTYTGKTHDKKIADQESVRYPKKTTLHKDTGFQGYEPNVAESHQPKKNRKGVS